VQLSTLPAFLRTEARRHPTLQVMLEPENTSKKRLESLKACDIDATVVVRPRAGIPDCRTKAELQVDGLAS